MKMRLATVLTALLVVVAGCSGGPMSGDATPIDDATVEDGADSADGDATDGGSDTTGSTGTVNFYVSDQPNDMDDFEHLNVTITQVQFHLVDGADDVTDNETTEMDDNETAETDDADDNETVTPEETVDADDNETTETAEPDDNETATPEETGDADGEDDADEAESEEEDEAEDEEADEAESEEEDSEGDGEWVTYDVDNRTADLTELRGPNATLVESFDVPAGEYDQVRLSIGEIDATLTSGESANVKLPSERLKLTQDFTVENGSDVDFVYDITVHKAGNSGKYILKPVVGESGTDVPIERVDDEREDEDDEDERSIRAAFLGSVTAGENVTVRVTENGSAVPNATVSVDDGDEGLTDADGEYVVSVPADAEELEIEVEAGDAEAELEREFEDREGATDDGETGADEAEGGDDGDRSGEASGDDGTAETDATTDVATALIG